jgi:hypothetical protein
MANQEVPEEIQDYYQTERRERAGVAWLLAFGTLVVTILLAGLIFFGGREAYRRIAGNDEPERADVAQNEQPEQDKTAEPNNEDRPSEENRPQPNNNEQEEGNAVQGNNDQNNPDPNPAPSPTPTPSQNPTPSPSPSTPATGDASGDLPGTGPANTIAIFFAVSILGYVVHRLYLKTS